MSDNSKKSHCILEKHNMKMSSFMSVDFYKPTLPRHTCTDKKKQSKQLSI